MQENEEIEPLEPLFRRAFLNPLGSVLDEWEKILDINYYPIFAVAHKILIMMPSHLAREVLLQLLPAAQGAHLVNAHELIGRVFQRLIDDRKYLATFYTLPVPLRPFSETRRRQNRRRPMERQGVYRAAARRRLRLRHGRSPLRGLSSDRGAA